jgi:two-component system, NarL family, response regulator LiaR
MSVIRTLLVDGHLLFAQTLAARLGREPDVEVLAVATEHQQARALLRALSPAVVVVDPAPHGAARPAAALEFIEEVRARHPACQVVVLTDSSDPDFAVETVRRGTRAWLPKTVDTAGLLRVIRGVARGESWIPPELLGYVLHQLTANQPPAGPNPVATLTARERDVLQCAVDGLSKLEIARRLFLSPNTVRTHTQNMLGKLPAHSMLEAVSLARRYGMRPSVT